MVSEQEAHTCDPSTVEAEVGRSCDAEANLGYIMRAETAETTV